MAKRELRKPQVAAYRLEQQANTLIGLQDLALKAARELLIYGKDENARQRMVSDLLDRSEGLAKYQAKAPETSGDHRLVLPLQIVLGDPGEPESEPPPLRRVGDPVVGGMSPQNLMGTPDDLRSPPELIGTCDELTVDGSSAEGEETRGHAESVLRVGG